MAQIYDSLRALIRPEISSGASTLLEEKESNVSNAFSSIIAGLLGVVLKKGNTQQLKNILEEAGKLNIASDIANICSEKPTQNQQRIGDDFLQHLLGDKAEDFTAPVASEASISKVAANRLISMAAPVVAGYLGNKLVKDKWSMSHLLDELDKEKNGFSNEIPNGIVKSFGLSSILNNSYTGTTNTTNTKKKNNRSWIIWVVIIVLLLLIILLWRSCRNNNTETYSEVSRVTYTSPYAATDRTTDRATTDRNMTDRSNTSTSSARSADRVSTQLSLPNGVKLKAFHGGIEDQMIKFLESNDYRNANDNDLANRWFVFDNIYFKFNSATELESGTEQINNIINILKYYKNAKVKIGGFADRVGTEDVNMQISKQRAKTIEAMLEKGGVGSQVVRTEGFGDEYAQHSANASEADRAEDRDVALRFVKQ